MEQQEAVKGILLQAPFLCPCHRPCRIASVASVASVVFLPSLVLFSVCVSV